MPENLIRKIRTSEGDLQIDYNALANLPDLGILSTKDEVAKNNLSSDVQASLNKADESVSKTYVDNAIGAIPTPDVSGQIDTHDTSTDAHNDIRELINKLDDDKLDASELTNAVNDTLAQAKASGEFDGKTPVKGVDYYTESDKTEIVNAVIEALPTWEGGSF